MVYANRFDLDSLDRTVFRELLNLGSPNITYLEELEIENTPIGSVLQEALLIPL